MRAILLLILTFMVQSLLLLACATPEPTTSTIHPSDLENSEMTEETRVAAFELRIERRDDPDSVELTKIGDWAINGPAEGVALHRALDGK